MRDYIKGAIGPERCALSVRHGEYLAQTGLKDQFQARSVPLGGTLVEWTGQPMIGVNQRENAMMAI